MCVHVCVCLCVCRKEYTGERVLESCHDMEQREFFLVSDSNQYSEQ